MTVAIRERLAALAHTQWSGWMQYLFSKCENNHGVVTIPASFAERWRRQMTTAYIDLPEEEKESDRQEANRVLALLGGQSWPLDGPHALDALAARVHQANARWWIDLDTGQPLQRNVGELLMLVVSELSEALEGHRKGLSDDKLPHRPMFEVEIADAIIRLLDIAGGKRLDLGGAFEEKLAYNAQRVDHTREHRLAAGGKRY